MKRGISPSLWNSKRQRAQGTLRPANEINLFIERERSKIHQVSASLMILQFFRQHTELINFAVALA
jgi:hypothetical protein